VGQGGCIHILGWKEVNSDSLPFKDSYWKSVRRIVECSPRVFWAGLPLHKSIVPETEKRLARYDEMIVNREVEQLG